MPTRDLAAEAESILQLGTFPEALVFITGNHWDSPPEPDWLPESRIWALIPAELAGRLIQKVLREPKLLTRAQAKSIVEAITLRLETHPDVADWRGLYLLVPDASSHLEAIKREKRLDREELQDIEEGRSSFEPMDEDVDPGDPYDEDDCPHCGQYISRCECS